MSGKPDISPLDAVVGRNVQRLRIDKDISQEVLAEAFGCSAGYISLLENGKRAWKNKWIWLASQILGADPVRLLGGVPATEEDLALFDAVKGRMETFQQEREIKKEISDAKK